MSLFSLIGVILFVVVALAGIILKITLRNRRKNLDGFHGYINMANLHGEENMEDEVEEDEWSSI